MKFQIPDHLVGYSALIKEYLPHMLGVDKYRQQSQWGCRNHFCAGIGEPDETDLAVLEGIGLVTRGRVINDGDSVFFHATEAGMDAIGLTKAQKKRAMEK